MPSDQCISDGGHHYVKMRSEPETSSSHSLRQHGPPELAWVFQELPKATIVSVSRPDASDITPMLLSYTIEFQYKHFRWTLSKKASQVVYLHFALKKRAFIEELHEKQEQVKEWLHNLGMGETTAYVHDDDDAEEDSVHLHHEETISARNRNVPSRAALSIIRPTLGRQQSISDRAKAAMQGYLNHFLGNLDIVNSPEVCKFLEVSRLSFFPEYGPKLKEGYVSVNHLPNIPKCGEASRCCACNWFRCCNGNWRKVWAVLKPGFFTLLKDPFDTKPLDIIIFDVLPPSDGNEDVQVLLARETKERYPLHFRFTVSCGSQAINLRVNSNAKVKGWVAAINDAVLRPPEGWCHPHRFGSFAPPRGLTEEGSDVQWFIDGQAAFDAIASSIEEAKSEIFITGWWLCPELYLRRPFLAHGSSRLDSLLEAKAKQGVQIYILLYKEVAIALKINSGYSKRRFLSIHENVKVLRYPDHFSTGVYLWSHHEKIVIVDNRVCYLGGLDLCFGRYDNYKHAVDDNPPLIWPGKDYYNPRESEPNSWEDAMKDELDRNKHPRMPWHDVQCALWGSPCRDVARHFVQRWNHAKRSKALHEEEIPLLMPHHHMVIPHYMGKNHEFNVDCKTQDISDRVQQQELFSSSPYQDIPLLLPREPDEPDKISRESEEMTHIAINPSRNASSVTFQKTNDEHTTIDLLLKDIVDDADPYKTQGQVDGIAQLPLLDKEWSDAQETGDGVVSSQEFGQVGPRVPCGCQVIRSVGQWSAGTCQTEDSIHNAYISLIEKAEHMVYIENQFFISGLSGDYIIRNRVLAALYRRILRAHSENKCFRVIIVIPLLPGFQGGLDDGGAATVRALIHWQYRTISRGSNSLLQNLYDIMGDKAHDYISFYGLRSYGRLHGGGCLATNQVYVHSKLMIVDDCLTLIGSANINDRSLLGSRDSEIGVVIKDKEFVGSFMDGKSWMAGKFALSLRLSLWSEHLGLRQDEIIQIHDPIIEETYKGIWVATAQKNSMIYQDVFSCVPNDLIHSRAAFRQSITYWKEKLGHTTIDLGISKEKLESHKNGDLEETDPIVGLQSVKGHLVHFPLNFMCHEDLRPVFNESEFYASPQIFH